jgi:RNA 3'-terminal phosphate cyclase (ATP)
MAALTQQPLRLDNVREGTQYHGLDVEDLILIAALTESCAAETTGVERGSKSFSFLPTARPRGLTKNFGRMAPEGQRGPNACVILNTLLPVLARTGMYSQLTAEGETYGTHALSFDYFSNITLAAYRRMGAWAVADQIRAGFGRESRGVISIEIEPSVIHGVQWTERGKLVEFRAQIATAGLPPMIGHRAISHFQNLAAHAGLKVEAEAYEVDAERAGCFVTAWARYENGLGGSTVMGTRGVRVETLVQKAFEETMSFMRAKSSVDENLADQILLAAALSEEGATFSTTCLTQRFLTSVWVIKQFLPIHITVRGSEGAAGTVTIKC